MFDITRLSADEMYVHQNDLVTLLQDAVDGGASVGFLAPLSSEAAAAYWERITREVADGERLILAASDNGHIVGSVQLALAMPPNGAHRAEVQKLLVHRAHRRAGIATALMNAVELAAKDAQRSLLVLDTQSGSDAERLYERLGYTRAGIIPYYALSSAGTYTDTVIFYRLI